MVNESELEVLKQYEAKGWRVLRGGAPDFLMLKVDDGRIVDFEFVEVKTEGSQLTYEQAIYKEILNKLGAKYKVEIVPNRPIPIQFAPTHPTPCQNMLGQASPPQPNLFPKEVKN